MSVSVGKRQGRLQRLSRWGAQSGGLRALSIIVMAMLTHSLAGPLRMYTGVVIDMTALGVTFCALELGLARGVVMALAVGYIGDVFAGLPTGLWLFGAGAAFVALRLVVVRIVGHSFWTVVSLAALATFIALTARGLLARSAGLSLDRQADLPPLLVTTVLFAYPVYWTYRLASDRFRKREDTLFR